MMMMMPTAQAVCLMMMMMDGWMGWDAIPGDLKSKETPYLLTRDDMKAAFFGLTPEQRSLLQRTADRIRAFAIAQKGSLHTIQGMSPYPSVDGSCASPQHNAHCRPSARTCVHARNE